MRKSATKSSCNVHVAIGLTSPTPDAAVRLTELVFDRLEGRNATHPREMAVRVHWKTIGHPIDP